MTATTTMRWNLWLTIQRLGTAAAAAIVLTLSGPVPAEGAVTALSTGSFEFELEIQVPGSPGAVFDLFTGDISPWWDHSFKQKPKKLYIEPKPGGGFYEIFDDEGNGVAVVARRESPGAAVDAVVRDRAGGQHVGSDHEGDLGMHGVAEAAVERLLERDEHAEGRRGEAKRGREEARHAACDQHEAQAEQD